MRINGALARRIPVRDCLLLLFAVPPAVFFLDEDDQLTMHGNSPSTKCSQKASNPDAVVSQSIKIRPLFWQLYLARELKSVNSVRGRDVCKRTFCK